MYQSKLVRCVIVLLMGFVIIHGYAQTDIPEGEVFGTWSLANSPYYINGEITIPNDSTLIIEPGVQIVFAGHFKFNVQGRLLAIGTVQDTIFFTAQQQSTGWHSIRFMNTPSSNDSSKIIYCRLQYGRATGAFPDDCGGAIIMTGFDKCLISNCLFQNNYAAYVGGGLVLGYGANPEIMNSIFINNRAQYGGGLGFVSNCNPMTLNNIIIHNTATVLGGGIQFNQNSNPVLLNNTIAFNQAGNGGGIDCRDNSDPKLINTILYGNISSDGSQVCLYVADCDPHFYNCDIEGGLDQFGGPGSGDSYTGIYENNMDSDPLFIDGTHDDYHLSDSSPCISAGSDSIQIGSNWYYAPSFDFEGNPRSNPAGSVSDIGALENELGNPTTLVCEAPDQLPQTYNLMQNYPNPFNPETTIQYQLHKSNHVLLEVFNLFGQHIVTLIDEKKSAGNYSLSWDASNYATGEYFISLKTDEYHKARKICLVR